MPQDRGGSSRCEKEKSAYHEKYEVGQPAEDECPNNDTQLSGSLLLFGKDHCRNIALLFFVFSLGVNFPVSEKRSNKRFHAVVTGAAGMSSLNFAMFLLLSATIMQLVITLGPGQQ